MDLFERVGGTDRGGEAEAEVEVEVKGGNARLFPVAHPAPRPSLILHEQGADNAPLSSVGEVIEEEVTDLFVYPFLNQRFIGSRSSSLRDCWLIFHAGNECFFAPIAGCRVDGELLANLSTAFPEPLNDVARKLREGERAVQAGPGPGIDGRRRPMGPSHGTHIEKQTEQGIRSICCLL